jgi:hypothetical protein
VFSVAAREVAQLAPADPARDALDARLAEHLRSHVKAWAGQRACDSVSEPHPLDARPGYQRVELRLHCSGIGPVRLRIASFLDVAPSHIHFARVRGVPGSGEYLFTAGRTEVDLDRRASGPDEPGAGASLADWVKMGVEHIAGGPDHLAFLLGLLLLCGGLREVIAVASGFTLGHSLTLALAVLGGLRPDAQQVESLIGLTIALVAAESAAAKSAARRPVALAAVLGLVGLAAVSARHADASAAVSLAGLGLFSGCYLALADTPRHARRIRPAVTSLFGLIHGFGFASPLLALGVPADRVVPALLGFNAGVELGQIAIVGALWGLGRALLSRWAGFPQRLARELSIAGLCGLGLYWFASRAWAVSS